MGVSVVVFAVLVDEEDAFVLTRKGENDPAGEGGSIFFIGSSLSRKSYLLKPQVRTVFYLVNTCFI